MRALDGPARGAGMGLRCCPRWLRLVTRPWECRPGDGGVRGIDDETGLPVLVDALDQPGDRPADDETVHVYRIVPGTWGYVFVRPGGRFENGDYRHYPVTDYDGAVPVDAAAPVEIGPPSALLRDRDEWVAWVARQEGMTVAELEQANRGTRP